MCGWHDCACPPVGRGSEKKGRGEGGDEALGRSRGGFSTKIHLICDGNGIPLHAELTGGQVNEAKVFVRVFRATQAALADEQGSTPLPPAKLAGDKAYRSDAIDRFLIGLGSEPVIPSRAGERPERRLVAFDREAYKRECGAPGGTPEGISSYRHAVREEGYTLHGHAYTSNDRDLPSPFGRLTSFQTGPSDPGRSPFFAPVARAHSR